jgi:hypothetical protein
MDIYLDTCLWNELFKQSIDPMSLTAKLEAKGCGLVLSDENVFECAQTFLATGIEGSHIGSALFTYLMGFIEARIRITKDNMALVAAEMQSIQWQLRIINPFLTADDLNVAQIVVEDCANGKLRDRAREHIEWRIRSNESGRRGIAHYIDNAPALNEALSRISEHELPRWIRWVRSTKDGVDYLAWQIKHYFDDQPFDEILEYAQRLQFSSANRVSMGLAARNFYFNWRYVHHHSIRKDLFADSNHIINANYCDVYATKEAKQGTYASLLLTSATRICIYDPAQMPLDRWLLSLCAMPEVPNTASE